MAATDSRRPRDGSSISIAPSVIFNRSITMRSGGAPVRDGSATPPSEPMAARNTGASMEASVKRSSPRMSGVADSSRRMASAVSDGNPGAEPEIFTRSIARRGVGSSVMEMGPSTATLAPVASDNCASTHSRWAFQSITYGPTKATVSTRASRPATIVRISRTSEAGSS